MACVTDILKIKILQRCNCNTCIREKKVGNTDNTQAGWDSCEGLYSPTSLDHFSSFLVTVLNTWRPQKEHHLNTTILLKF